MAVFSQTVVDNFNDNSISPDWFNWGTGSNVQETGGQLRITSNTGAGNYQGMDRASPVNFDETWWGVRVVSAGTQQPQLETVPCQANFGGENAFYWSIRNGQATCWTAINGNYTQRGTGIAYNPSTHVYFAIGINAAGELSWIWSTDGTNFTEHATLSNPYGSTTATFVFYAGRESSGGSDTIVIFDDFSSWVASAAATGTLTGTLPVLTGSLAGKASVSGTLTGTLPALVGSIVALETGVQATLGGQLPMLSGQIHGRVRSRGRTVTLPGGLIPVRSLSTDEILTGNRVTRVRIDLLSESEAPKGRLAGVTGGFIELIANASVHGGGSITVVDIGQAVDWLTDRIKPVIIIDGLPEQPLGVYLASEAPEHWGGTGRTWSIKLLDKLSILDQDAVEDTYALDAGTVVTDKIVELIESTGETNHAITPSPATLSAPLVWEPATSKLKIINDLLSTINYFSLYCDHNGQYRGEPYVRPANRPILWEFLDGEKSIYSPEFTRDRDLYGIPNKVIVVSQGTGTEPALTATATNSDPSSPYSTVSRGRTIVHKETGVEIVDQDTLDNYARRRLIELTSPTSSIDVSHAYVPGLTFNAAVRVRNVPAGIDHRHVITKMWVSLDPTVLARSTLREVVDL